MSGNETTTEYVNPRQRLHQLQNAGWSRTEALVKTVEEFHHASAANALTEAVAEGQPTIVAYETLYELAPMGWRLGRAHGFRHVG